MPVSLPPPSQPIPVFAGGARADAAADRASARRRDRGLGRLNRRRAPSRCSRSTSSASCGCSRRSPRLAARVTERVPAVKADVAAIGELLQLAHGSPRPATVRIGTPAPAARLLALVPGGAAALRRPLGAARGGQLHRVGLRQGAQRERRRRAGTDAVHAGDLDGLRARRRRPRPARRHPRRREPPRRERRAAATSALRSTATTTPRSTSTRCCTYARAIARDPHRFLVYYSRQVYARTATGIRRITGPR